MGLDSNASSLREQRLMCRALDMAADMLDIPAETAESAATGDADDEERGCQEQQSAMDG